MIIIKKKNKQNKNPVLNHFILSLSFLLDQFKLKMKFSAILAVLYTAAVGSAAAICQPGTNSAPLVLEGADKEAAVQMYREKYSDAEIPDGPLKVTTDADGSLRINFKDSEGDPVEVACSGQQKDTNDGTVSAENISTGDNILSGFNNWTLHWNGPNINLNLPSRGSMRFPTFTLDGVADDQN